MTTPHPAQLASFSILDVVRGMLRRWLLIFFCLALGALAGYGVITLIRPQFVSEAHVLIDNLSTPFDNALNAQESRVDAIDDRFVASQVLVLKSGDIAARVMRQLQLAGKGEFETDTGRIGTLKSLMIRYGFTADPRLMTAEQRALDRLNDQLAVYQLPQSNVIAVRYTALDGKTAAAIANALAELYVLSTRESQSGPNERAREWLASQIAGLRNKVAKSEAAVEKFRAEAGLLKGQTATLGAQEISELNTQITLAEAASSEAAARADEIRSMLETRGSVDASLDVLNSPVIQRLREQQLAAAQKLSQLSATYLPNHPKMLAAERERADVDRQVRREALKIVDGLQGQAKIAAARAKSLRTSLEQLKDREGGALQSDVQLKELEREAQADRSLLESFLTRYADASARQDLSLQPGFARVIQTAAAPVAASFPKTGPTMALFSLAGLGLGIGLAFLMEIMAQAARLNEMAVGALRSPEQDLRPELAKVIALLRDKDMAPPRQTVEQPAPVNSVGRQPQAAATEAPPAVLATLPASPSLNEALQLLGQWDQGRAAFSPFERIASSLIETAQQSGTRTFGVTSIGASFEAALATVAIARMLSATKNKVLIIDASGRKPTAMDLMGLPDGPGLAELINGTADVARIIARDERSSVQLLRYGMASGQGNTAILTQKIRVIVTALSHVYGFILVHGGEAGPSTPSLFSGCDAVLFLTTGARQRDAAAAARTLASRGIRRSLFVRLGETVSPARQAG